MIKYFLGNVERRRTVILSIAKDLGVTITVKPRCFTVLNVTGFNPSSCQPRARMIK